MTFLALIPLVSYPLLLLAHHGRWKSAAAGAGIIGALFFVLAEHAALPGIGPLYLVLFLAVAVFPWLLREDVQRASRDNLTRKIFLQSEVSKGRLVCDKLDERRAKLLSDMDQITQRYAFAKSLVSHLDEKPILQDLGSILASEKIVLGMAFSRAERVESDPTLFDENTEEPVVTWAPVFTNGWINEEEWKKMLKIVQFPQDLETNAVVIDLLSQHPLTSFIEFRRLLLTGKDVWKERKESLFLIGVPVRWDGKVQGLLTFLLENDLPDHFLDEVSVYAQLLSLGLQKTSLYRIVLEQSRRDGLTNLYLRHILLERMNEEVNFTRRYGTSFSLIMLDLDFFKSVNDTYGHQAGDAVLREIANCLRSNLHPGVTICRYGGEEFAVLIGLAPQDEVLQIAERMRKAIAALRIRVNERNLIGITASFGVSHFLPDAPTAEELIRRADIALYRAKESGRNCVKEWGDRPPVQKSGSPVQVF